MKIYVDEQKRYEDTKATGQCFTGVGAIGLIAIVLLDTGVIKLAALDSVNKLMVSIVMGLVFLIFFIIGMKSFMELKDISKKIDRNNSLEEEIMEYVTVTHRDELMTLASSGEKEMPAQVIYTTKELSLSHQSLLKNTACLRKASSIIWLKKFILKFIVILSKNSAIIITIYFL